MFHSLEHKHMIMIIAGLIGAIFLLYFYVWGSNVEAFKESLATRVTTADGACESRHPSIVDYYSQPYPFYERNSYFKPLEQLKPVNDNNSINFERRHYTTLYTSPQ
jgi:hypothetical protein